jgi:hypothetical protein
MRLEASLDAEQARDYLESQRPGLGQAFLDRLKDTLTRISHLPELYGTVWRNVRVCAASHMSSTTESTPIVPKSLR